MKRFLGIFAILLLLVLSGCSKEDDSPVPTASLAAVDSGAVQDLSLADLATDPAVYEDRPVQLTGRYGALPLPPCDQVLHLSPATWVLSDAGVIVRVAGLENIVDLAPDELTMTVSGFWRRWDGPIGCGDAAVASTIWHLEAERIVSPNPLSRATLTPFGLAEITPATGAVSSPTAWNNTVFL